MSGYTAISETTTTRTVSIRWLTRATVEYLAIGAIGAALFVGAAAIYCYPIISGPMAAISIFAYSLGRRRTLGVSNRLSGQKRVIFVGSPLAVGEAIDAMTSKARASIKVLSICDDGVPDFVRNLTPLFQKELEVDEIIIAKPGSNRDDVAEMLRKLAPFDTSVELLADPSIAGLSDLRLGSLPTIPLREAALAGWDRSTKRAEDLILGLFLFILTVPLMLLIAVAIKVSSPGPVLFRQRRLGYNNKLIEILKFRSMYVHLSDTNLGWGAMRGDKRVTPVGGWLRKSGLDELPQLLNVIRGDMSLVGPRPHALATTAGGLALEDAVPVYSSRHRVKPGITGWAQVNGYRGPLDSVDKIVQRVNHDLYYIENWSLWFDIKILLRTLLLLVRDENAF